MTPARIRVLCNRLAVFLALLFGIPGIVCLGLWVAGRLELINTLEQLDMEQDVPLGLALICLITALVGSATAWAGGLFVAGYVDRKK